LKNEKKMKNSFLSSTNVSINETFTPMLEDLQANILKHHGRAFAFHIFVTFQDLAKTKIWISDFADSKITSTFDQLEASKLHKSKGIDGGTILNLSLSNDGYDFLGLNDKRPNDSAFRKGLKKRTSILNDTVADWDQCFKNDIHCLIIVADDNEQTAMSTTAKIETELGSFAKVVNKQRGKVLKKGDIGIEHFGYADGISQPIYLQDEISRQGERIEWDDTANLDKLLVKDLGGLNKNSYGSLLVFRKLEQNVMAFKTAEGLLNPVIPKVFALQEEGFHLMT
jgi:deferrochelatase/peroxidase EfeB